MPSKIRFKIVFCSSEDPEFPVSELNYHTPHTKGWLSQRFCDYPQEIGIAFDSLTHIQQLQILSHESKVATKIELFVGDASSKAARVEYGSAKFKRLGHLSLDSNERSQYQARELKSVHLNTHAVFLKLVLHKCYLNKSNLYNQVGIIALSILGDPIESQEQQSLPSMGRTPPTNGVAGHKNISPVDDLTMDLNVDSYTANRIREIYKAKEAAVANEDYDLAKRLKATFANLKELGAQLAKLEIKKKNAVQNEDYDTAKGLKVEIDNLRGLVDKIAQSAHSQSASTGLPPVLFAEQESAVPPARKSGFPANNNNSSSNASLPRNSSSAPSSNAPSISSSRGPPSRQDSAASSDSLPSAPAMSVASSRGTSVSSSIKEPKPAAQSRPGKGEGRAAAPPPPPPPQPTGDNEEDRPIPALANRNARGEAVIEIAEGDGGEQVVIPVPGRYNLEAIAAQDPGPVISNGSLPEPEPLSGPALKEANQLGLVDFFGDAILRMLYSRTWNHRERAVTTVSSQLPTYDFDSPTTLKAVCKFLEKGLSDKIAQVFATSLTLLHEVLDDYAGKLRKADVCTHLDGPALSLVAKAGDTNARNKEMANEAIVYVALHPNAGPAAVCPSIIRMNDKPAQWRPVLGKCTLLTLLLPEIQIGPATGLPLEGLMAFLSFALASPNGDVRNMAVKACVLVHTQTGPRMMPLLKNVTSAVLDVVKQSIEAGPIEEEPPAYVSKAREQATASSKPAQQQKGGGGAKPQKGPPPEQDENASKRGGGKQQQQQSGGRGGNVRPAADDSEAFPVEEVPVSLRKSRNDPHASMNGAAEEEDEEGDPSTCQFCGKREPSFEEEGVLDLHFVESCPMLCECSLCEQVVEIACLFEHLTTECAQKGQNRICARCKEPIAASEYADHVKAKSCNPAKPPNQFVRCPLCHNDLPNSDDVWFGHLLNGQGCLFNKRTANLRTSAKRRVQSTKGR
mmetsp:Transcript_2687/g.4774  ORF Transcript_2687/g.4774 Transcript_2687/m.4774 type:complete len:965 (-) Transcript_2687:91-2985(-)